MGRYKEEEHEVGIRMQTLEFVMREIVHQVETCSENSHLQKTGRPSGVTSHLHEAHATV